jgi:hypothetical protein
MAVPSSPEPGVMLSIVGITLYAVSRPVITGISETLIAGVPHDDIALFSALPRYGSESCVGAKCVVVPFCEGNPSFGEQSSDTAAAEARKRPQQRDVLALIAITPGDQVIDPFAYMRPLLAQELQPAYKQECTFADYFGRSSRDEQRRRLEHDRDLSRRYSPDPVFLERRLDPRIPQFRGARRQRRNL